MSKTAEPCRVKIPNFLKFPNKPEFNKKTFGSTAGGFTARGGVSIHGEDYRRLARLVVCRIAQGRHIVLNLQRNAAPRHAGLAPASSVFEYRQAAKSRAAGDPRRRSAGATKHTASRAKLNLYNTRRRGTDALRRSFPYHFPKCIFCFAVYSTCSISGASSAGTPIPM